MALRSINIELRDIMNDELARQELLEGGGKAVVPCLKIKNGDSVDWLYESMDIIPVSYTHLTLPTTLTV